jgi:hypothetical protein
LENHAPGPQYYPAVTHTTSADISSFKAFQMATHGPHFKGLYAWTQRRT